MRHSILLSLSLLLAGCSQAPPEPASTGPSATGRPAIDQAAGDESIIDQPAEAIPPATAPVPDAGPARFDGYAGMRFGMTEDEARSALDGGLEAPAGDPDDACHYLVPVGAAPRDLAFMFDGGRFVRYDVGNDEATAPGGGRRGMSAERIQALYAGRVEARPHAYVDGQYLRIRDTRSDGVLVFETDAEGKVTEWRAGLAPQVDYVEGCS